MPEIETYCPGDRVLIGPEDDPISGVIDAIVITAGNVVSYTVSYWADTEELTKTFEAYKVRPSQAERLRIGFQT